MDLLLQQLDESRAQNFNLAQQLDDVMITNKTLKTKSVSNDAHSFVQLQLQKELDSKKKQDKQMKSIHDENVSLRAELMKSQISEKFTNVENTQLIRKMKELNEQGEREKGINKTKIMGLKQKLLNAQKTAGNQSKNSKKFGTKWFANNSAARFNKVNELLKDTKWTLEIEKGKVTKLENEIRKLKADILKEQRDDLKKAKYEEESKGLMEEIARLKKEIEDKSNGHKLELKQSFDKMITMQTEWKKKEDNLQFYISQARIKSQTELAQLRYNLKKAQSTNEAKELKKLIEEKKKWESSSRDNKERIALLVDARDEQDRRYKDLEDKLALAKEAVHKSSEVGHADLRNSTQEENSSKAYKEQIAILSGRCKKLEDDLAHSKETLFKILSSRY